MINALFFVQSHAAFKALPAHYLLGLFNIAVSKGDVVHVSMLQARRLTAQLCD